MSPACVLRLLPLGDNAAHPFGANPSRETRHVGRRESLEWQ